MYLSGGVNRDKAIELLCVSAMLGVENKDIEYFGGLYVLNELYQLQDKDGNLLEPPAPGMTIIGPELCEIYGIIPGDLLAMTLEGQPFRVKLSCLLNLTS